MLWQTLQQLTSKIAATGTAIVRHIQLDWTVSQLASGNFETRARAITKLRNSRSIEPLIRVINSEYHDVQCDAIEALAWIPTGFF